MKDRRELKQMSSDHPAIHQSPSSPVSLPDEPLDHGTGEIGDHHLCIVPMESFVESPEEDI